MDIKRKTAIMFLGEMLDENTSWIDNICIVETKLTKYIQIPYCATILLEEKP